MMVMVVVVVVIRMKILVMVMILTTMRRQDSGKIWCSLGVMWNEQEKQRKKDIEHSDKKIETSPPWRKCDCGTSCG